MEREASLLFRAHRKVDISIQLLPARCQTGIMQFHLQSSELWECSAAAALTDGWMDVPSKAANPLPEGRLPAPGFRMGGQAWAGFESGN